MYLQYAEDHLGIRDVHLAAVDVEEDPGALAPQGGRVDVGRRGGVNLAAGGRTHLQRRGCRRIQLDTI